MNESIDLATLRVIVAASDLGSISAASLHLNLAVAAASARITALEDTIGFRIFERSPRGVQLTADGNMLVQRGKKLISDADRLYSDMQDYGRGLQGYVRILANSSSVIEVLPKRIEAFKRAHPLIQIGLDECGSTEIPMALMEGRADIGIVDLPVAPRSMQCIDFFSDTLVLIVPFNHPLARRDSLLLQDALDEEFITMHESTALSNRLSAAATASGRTLRISMRMRGFDAVTRMIAVGLGIGVLPYEAVSPQLATLPIKAIALEDSWARRTHRIISRDDVSQSPAARTMIQALTRQ